MISGNTYWDHIAKTSGFYHMGPAPYREYILDRLTGLGVQTILEEGCGTGPIYQLIKDTFINDSNRHGHNSPYPRWNFTYKGTDFATEMIKVCKKHFPQGNFEVQDARKPKESNSSWDAVLLIDTLDHLDNYKSVIKEAARIAKRIVVICLWRGYVSEGTSLNDINMIDKSPGEKPWEDTHLQAYSKEALMREFVKNNLEVLEFNDSALIREDQQARSLWILTK